MTKGRTPLPDAFPETVLPNFLDQRPNRIARTTGGDAMFAYWMAADGATVVTTAYAGTAKGMSPQGRRFASIADAVAAVRTARAEIAARWDRKGYAYTLRD